MARVDIEKTIEHVRRKVVADVNGDAVDAACTGLDIDLMRKVLPMVPRHRIARQSAFRTIQTEAVAELIVMRPSWRGAASFKPRNVDSEIRRTVNFSLLAGLAPSSMAYASNPFAPLAILVGLSFSGITALSASISYTDACVLTKAWQLSAGRKINQDTLVEAHLVLRDEYSLPKCENKNEVRESIEKLISIKSMKRHGETLTLQEKVLIAADGALRFADERA